MSNFLRASYNDCSFKETVLKSNTSLSTLQDRLDVNTNINCEILQMKRHNRR